MYFQKQRRGKGKQKGRKEVTLNNRLISIMGELIKNQNHKNPVSMFNVLKAE